MFYINNKSVSIIIAFGLLLTLPSYSQNVFNNPKESTGKSILNNTINNNPNSKTAKIICAKVYIKNGDYLEAENLLMQVLEEDPNNSKANKLLKDLNKLYSTHIEDKNTSDNEEIKKVEAIPSQIEQPIIKNDKKLEIAEVTQLKPTHARPVETNKGKLPTKEEILKRAKARKQAESDISEDNVMPLAIQAPKIGKVKTTNISEEPKATEKTDFIEPITIAPQASEEDLEPGNNLPEKKTLKIKKNP